MIGERQRFAIFIVLFIKSCAQQHNSLFIFCIAWRCLVHFFRQKTLSPNIAIRCGLRQITLITFCCLDHQVWTSARSIVYITVKSIPTNRRIMPNWTRVTASALCGLRISTPHSMTSSAATVGNIVYCLTCLSEVTIHYSVRVSVCLSACMCVCLFAYNLQTAGTMASKFSG